MPVKSDEKIFNMIGMFRNLTVKDSKNFAQKEKDIDGNSIGHNLGKGLNLFFSRIIIGHPADNEAEKNQ